MACRKWLIIHERNLNEREAAAQALKMLLAVVRHFGDFAEDQFDFHSYCVRKLTLRAYVAMLRMQDVLRSNAFFAKAGCALCFPYMNVYYTPVRLHGASR